MGGMRPMGGGRSAMGMGSREVPRAAKLYVEGVSIILKQSETGDTLWGYSEKLGKWSKLAIPKGPDLLTPVVGANVGVFLGGGRIYAFSGSTGRWAELKTAAMPTVAASKITVTDGDQVFIFSDVHGRWSSNAEAYDDQPATADPSDPENFKTSSLLVDETGRQIEMGDFDSDGRLDVIVHPTPGRRRTIKYYDNNGRLDRTVPESSKKMSAADLLAAFQELSQESERRTIQAGEEYREALRLGGEKGPRTIELRSTLAKLVTESFDRRQQAQRLEAEILRRRLRRVDERLTERERLKSQIIQHRLEELQNTNVRWDAETGNQTKDHAKSKPLAEKKPPQSKIREFVARGTSSANVGIVSDVSDDGWIELSPAKVFGIRAGDELEVVIHEPVPDGMLSHSFARVVVLEAQPETARARLVESTRTLIDGKFGWQPVVKGNTVSRPIETAEDDKQPRGSEGVGTVRDLRADGIRPHFVVREPDESAGQSVMRLRSEPVVCVRGFLPRDELLQDPNAVARHTRNRQRPGTVELSDFQIERQQAAGTPATWDDVPWNACSIANSINVLSSCEDFDTYAGPEMISSEALTSPLPHLSDGAWDDRVLHPKPMNAGKGPVPDVLFRFLDFDVKAGQSYRYRVKLLYTASKTADVQPGPWSEPSTVVRVTDNAE